MYRSGRTRIPVARFRCPTSNPSSAPSRCCAVSPADRPASPSCRARSKLPKSTVSRLLATLVEIGAVEQLAGGLYRVGDAVLDIAAGATPGRHLVAVARPSLTELVDALGEDAGLSVLDGVDVYYLDQVRADVPVRLRDWTGERVPAHCVSSGLVLLAHAPAGRAPSPRSPDRSCGARRGRPSNRTRLRATPRRRGRPAR